MLLVLIIIIAILLGGAYFLVKSPQNIDVAWTENDYKSYQQKVSAGNEQPGNFDLASIAEGKFTSSGKKTLDVAYTSEEISSVLSKENDIKGPIRDIKVKFLSDNEGEATFILTKDIDQYITRTSETLLRYPFIKNSLEGTPVYLKTKIDKASDNSITADIQTLSLGKISLPENVISKVESSAIPAINRMLQNYNGLSIQELKIVDGKMHFKGTIPSEITAK